MCRVQYIIVVNLISVYGQQINDLQKKLKVSSVYFEKKKKEKRRKCGRFKGQQLATRKRQPKRVWPTKVSPYNGCLMFSAIITGKMITDNGYYYYYVFEIFFLWMCVRSVIAIAHGRSPLSTFFCLLLLLRFVAPNDIMHIH